MIKHTEVMKQALEALEIERNVPRLGPVPTKTSKAITALREALTSVPDWASEAKEQPAPVAKPRKQEPVAWLDPWTRNNVTTDYDAYGKHGIPLYTSPPAQRTWVGLTDEDHAEVKDVMIHVGVGAGVAWIENKLREKNGITKEQT